MEGNLTSLGGDRSIAESFKCSTMKKEEKEKAESDSLNNGNEEKAQDLANDDNAILMRMKKRRDENEALKNLLNNLNPTKKK